MGKSYADRKEQVAGILREQSKTGRDIGPLPAVVDPARRESSRLNFQRFCEIYFAAVFAIAWSDDHLRVIKIIEDAVLHGGLFAVAMPRGSGKSSLCLAAAIWSLVYGHCSFVVLIGASEDHAVKLLKNLITDFNSNDLLNADFPEVCYPIRCLELITKRAQGQLLDGEPTRITWTTKELVLPTIEGSAASGSRIAVCGITGAIRGMNAKLAHGSSIRPDFCLIDDPQTTESANSPKQVRDRLAIVNGDILGLAGPGEKISAVMPCTVIAKGDAADQVLDRKKNPVWQGVRTKLLKTAPKDTKLWEEYADVWANSLREFGNIEAATKFYLAKQSAMDDGAEASWSDRFNEDEASAIQHAMNLKLRDEASFAAEYQNEPLNLELNHELNLTADRVAQKVVGLRRGLLPSYTQKLTAFIDVGGKVHFWGVVAVGKDYTSHVPDYGCFPQQSKSWFYSREASPSLADQFTGLSPEGQIRAGLSSLTKMLLDREWPIDGGGTKQIDKLIIDSGWHPDIVKQFIAESGVYKTRMIASKGYGVKAEAKPMDAWTTVNEKAGDRRGWSWIIKRDEGHLLFDTNQWKTFTVQRLLMSAGEVGNLSIFDDEKKAMVHKLFCDQVTAERADRVTSEGTGRTVNIWTKDPNRENHLLDCLVGCMVAASEQGIRFIGHQEQTGNRPAGKRRKMQVSF